MEKLIAKAFPTLIGYFRRPESELVNRDLRELILDRERSTPSQPRANAGGWHSAADAMDWPSPAIHTLRNWIGEAMRDMIDSTMEMMAASGMPRQFRGSVQLHAWANIARQGNYHRVHNHPGCCWSGVYYVDAGHPAPDQPLSGVLDLIDPRPFTEMVTTPGEPYGQKLIVRPEAGLMVLFPSWLYHFVNPYMGEGERISIAFNIKVTEGTVDNPPRKQAM